MATFHLICAELFACLAFLMGTFALAISSSLKGDMKPGLWYYTALLMGLSILFAILFAVLSK